MRQTESEVFVQVYSEEIKVKKLYMKKSDKTMEKKY